MADKTEAEIRAELEAKIREELKSEAEKKAKEIAEAKAKEEAEKAAKLEAEKKAAEDAKAKEKSEKEALEKAIEDKIASEVAKIKENFVPKSAAVQERSGKWVEEGADEQVAKLKSALETGYAKIEIDLDSWLTAHTKKAVTEAVSTSGTIPGVNTMTDIVIIPGGVSVKPIRQWCDFQTIPQGDDTVRFYSIDIPAFGNITESPTTDITAATHTLTAIDVTANTVRGFRQTIEKMEIEKYPAVLLSKIRDTARLRAIQDEANIVLTTAGSTANDFGSNHFSGSDGAAVTTTTLEDAAGEFLHDGLRRGKRRLMEQEHETGPGMLVLACSPRAYDTLTADADISTFVQQGDPSLTKLGRVEMFLGIEILVTNNLQTANNAIRNILFVKGKAFAVASGRTLEIEVAKEIRGQVFDVVATHRVGAGILDATAYVILSSQNN